MRKIFNIPIDNATPSAEMVIRAQGIPRSVTPDERTVRLAQEAISVYRSMAKPTGVIMEVSIEEFEATYAGEGSNNSSSPIEPIFRQSGDLALFAVTIEEEICQEISRQFSIGEYALGSMIDTVASEGTEMTAQAVEDFYRGHLQAINRFDSGSGILRFSPGYCGWHISGQKKLFQSLHPEDISIELNQSYLMRPIKSISGIIITGRNEIFRFDDSFSFCADCATHSCRERIEAIQRQ